MNDDGLLDYLKDYVANPRVLSLGQLSEGERNSLPSSWLDILSYENNERINKALDYWMKFEVEFEQVVEYIRDNIVSIHLVHHGFGYCLIYGITSADKKRTLYYEGRNPKAKTISPVVASVWNSLPDNLKNFYNDFHNGWYYLASGSMGLSPVEDFFFLDEEEWGILDEIGKPPIDLEGTLAVFANGMGGYVCLEIIKNNNTSSLLWWSNKPPKLGLDFWSIVDSWTVMGFES